MKINTNSVLPTIIISIQAPGDSVYPRVGRGEYPGLYVQASTLGVGGGGEEIPVGHCASVVPKSRIASTTCAEIGRILQNVDILLEIIRPCHQLILGR